MDTIDPENSFMDCLQHKHGICEMFVEIMENFLMSMINVLIFFKRPY